MAELAFTKMHGCGNDYVYVDLSREKVPQPAKLAAAMSDRHTGVGADGLILILPSRAADVRMRMFNADGSEGEMCGNGIRCIGKYAYENGLSRRSRITVETAGGVVDLHLHVRGGRVSAVTVNMGAPRPIPRDFHRGADGSRRLLRARVAGHPALVLSMGNPHCVLLAGAGRSWPVERLGPRIERHLHFPRRTNVEFVNVLSRRRLRQRTWERGSGETLCCGSGACAAVAAAIADGRTDRRVRVELLGGTLEIEQDERDRLWMTGPAVEVFRGEWPNARGRGRVPR